MSVAAYVFSLFVRQGKVFILLFSFIVFEIFSTIDTVLVSMASKGKCYLMTSILNYMSTCTHSQAGKNYIYILLVMLSFVIAEILVVKRKIKEAMTPPGMGAGYRFLWCVGNWKGIWIYRKKWFGKDNDIEIDCWAYKS